jgi:7-cyano-7-deazaguanine synthase
MKAVVLLSGGLDSATALAVAQRDGYECIALSFDYGQRQRAELTAAARLAKTMQVADHRVLRLPLNEIGGSALTDHSLAVPEEAQAGIPITYVPARNTIFLSLALGVAEVTRAGAIFIGVNAVDYSGYPDCRPQFIDAFAALARVATRQAVNGEPVQIEAPLIGLGKAEIIRLGASLGVDYGLTVSCYQAGDDGTACGVCEACGLRLAGFAASGLSDPTQYYN